MFAHIFFSSRWLPLVITGMQNYRAFSHRYTYGFFEHRAHRRFRTLSSLLRGYRSRLLLSFHAARRKQIFINSLDRSLWVSDLVRGTHWKTILGSDGVLKGFSILHVTPRTRQLFSIAPSNSS